MPKRGLMHFALKTLLYSDHGILETIFLCAAEEVIFEMLY
jgi:hypothetical protein